MTGSRRVTWTDLSLLPPPAPGERIEYGSEPAQFGELRLPSGAGPHPVVVVLHGGCWRSENDLGHISHLSAALAAAGVATWTLEYRRIGDPGGGWTGTFVDAALGAGFVRDLGRRFPLNLDRVVLLGHSAGGHLALWLAARRNLPGESPLLFSASISIRGVVALAAITDLAAYGSGRGYCPQSVAPLLGGTPEEVPDRYAQTSPIELLPLGVPSRLLHGAFDSLVPVAQSRNFVARARAMEDDGELSVIDEAGHFDLIAPFAPSWDRVRRKVFSLLEG